MSSDTPVTTASNAWRDESEPEIQRRLSQTLEEVVPVSTRSIVVALLANLLLRITGRTSFVILSFYLGEHFASATLVAVILETFYLSELIVAPLIGSLSDSRGRKPFLLLSPVLAGAAATCLLVAARLFPLPNVDVMSPGLIILLLIILAGRLLEGTATGMNVPATLGFLTDATVHSEQLRARVVTAFEIVTVGGLALAIPLGGRVSSWLGTWGFLIVIVLYLVTALMVAFGVSESVNRQSGADAHSSLFESLTVIRHKRIFTFLPAWFSVNALVGAWTVLIMIMLAYPLPEADLRHPRQLLYGGFTPLSATIWVGVFALVFLVGMGLWIPLLSRLRRTSIMLIGLGGLLLAIAALSLLNGLGENPRVLTESAKPVALLLLGFTIIGILLLSGFTPVALTQMGAIAETLPGKRGAVMGLYSVVLAIGQLLGAMLGGLSVDIGGFYGLMVFSVLMCLLSLGSVLYIRSHQHDLIKGPVKTKKLS